MVHGFLPEIHPRAPHWGLPVCSRSPGTPPPGRGPSNPGAPFFLPQDPAWQRAGTFLERHKQQIGGGAAGPSGGGREGGGVQKSLSRWVSQGSGTGRGGWVRTDGDAAPGPLGSPGHSSHLLSSQHLEEVRVPVTGTPQEGTGGRGSSWQGFNPAGSLSSRL